MNACACICMVENNKQHFFHNFRMIFIVFDCASACTSMRSLVKIHDTPRNQSVSLYPNLPKFGLRHYSWKDLSNSVQLVEALLQHETSSCSRCCSRFWITPTNLKAICWSTMVEITDQQLIGPTWAIAIINIYYSNPPDAHMYNENMRQLQSTCRFANLSE